MECQVLIDKITERIKTTYARQLSYAGRLHVIVAVLFSIHSFWRSVFILPQRVVKEVDKKCREYLWGTTRDRKKVALIAWDKICVPKKYGGLNIKGCGNWNVASVGKLIWQLALKEDSL
uniref:Tn7 reverse transcriptase n=1 Tax=Solanum tuberosum TaxID=4113 RepID=M1AY26_SOLTU